MSEQEVKQEKRETTVVPWLIAGILLAAVWSSSAITGSVQSQRFVSRYGSYPEIFGSALGHALIIAVVIWAPLYFLVMRRRAPENRPPSFAMFFIAALLAEGAMIFLTANAAHSADAQSQIAVSEAQKAEAKVLHPGTGNVDMHIESTGEAGEMERLGKLLAARTLATEQQYQSTISTLQYPAFMKPDQLVIGSNLIDAKDKLENARAAVQTLRDGIKQNIILLRQDAQASKMSSAAKTGFLRGVDESFSKGQANMAKILECEDGIITEYENIADLLIRSQGRWNVSTSRIMFNDAVDLQEYQARVQRIQTLAQEKRELNLQNLNEQSALDSRLSAAAAK